MLPRRLTDTRRDGGRFPSIQDGGIRTETTTGWLTETVTGLTVVLARKWNNSRTTRDPNEQIRTSLPTYVVIRVSLYSAFPKTSDRIPYTTTISRCNHRLQLYYDSFLIHQHLYLSCYYIPKHLKLYVCSTLRIGRVKSCLHVTGRLPHMGGSSR